MPNPIESLLEIYGDMVEVLLVLKIFLTEDSWVDYLLGGAPPCSEACLFFSNDFLRLRLQSVLYDLSITAYEADRSVVLALLQVAFLVKCNDQGLGPQDWPLSRLKDLAANCRESGDYYIQATCLDQFCWDVVDSG